MFVPTPEQDSSFLVFIDNLTILRVLSSNWLWAPVSFLEKNMNLEFIELINNLSQ
jgi:hypothetical protein